jgi:hypothetical protein
VKKAIYEVFYIYTTRIVQFAVSQAGDPLEVTCESIFTTTKKGEDDIRSSLQSKLHIFCSFHDFCDLRDDCGVCDIYDELGFEICNLHVGFYRCDVRDSLPCR